MMVLITAMQYDMFLCLLELCDIFLIFLAVCSYVSQYLVHFPKPNQLCSFEWSNLIYLTKDF